MKYSVILEHIKTHSYMESLRATKEILFLAVTEFSEQFELK